MNGMRGDMMQNIYKWTNKVFSNSVYYLIVLAIAVLLKAHYSKAGSDELDWILQPTSALVELGSDIEFEKESLEGYVSQDKRIIIAPSCSGVNFMIIAFCLFTIPVIHLFHSKIIKLKFLFSGCLLAYGVTLLVNTIRIIASIHLYNADIYNGWITPDMVHRVTGIFIYFFFLYIFYFMICSGVYYLKNTQVDSAHLKQTKTATGFVPLKAGIVSLGFYVFFSIAVPFTNGAYQHYGIKFLQHSKIVAGAGLIVMAAVLILILLIQSGTVFIRKYLMKGEAPIEPEISIDRR